MWPSEEASNGPALLIVQCKRQKADVEKIVVKGLWADMSEYGASRGLIATTSSLAPGASNTIRARKYGIDVADGTAIPLWLETMQTPWTGPSLIDGINDVCD